MKEDREKSVHYERKEYKVRIFEILYLVIGRNCVLFTLESKSLSHMSLIVHPAPLMTKAPAAKRLISAGSGMGAPGGEARPKLQPQGQKSNQEPIGLSIRINFK